jgi:chromosome segregation ATPase
MDKSDLEAKVKELSSSLETTSKQLASLEQESTNSKKELEKQLSTAQASLADVRNQLEEAQHKALQMEAELNHERKKLTNVTETNQSEVKNAVEEAVSEWRDAVTGMQAQVRDVEDKLIQRTDEAERAQDQVTSLEKQLEHQRHQMEGLKEEMLQVGSKSAELQNLLDTRQREWEMELAMLQETNSKLELNVDELASAKAHAESRVESVKDEYAQQVAQTKQMAEGEWKQQLESLSQQVKTHETQSNEWQSKLRALESSLQSTTHNLLAAEEKTKLVDLEKQSLQQKLVQLQHNLEQHAGNAATVAAHANMTNQLRDENTVLRQQVNTLQQRLDSANAQNSLAPRPSSRSQGFPSSIDGFDDDKDMDWRTGTIIAPPGDERMERTVRNITKRAAWASRKFLDSMVRNQQTRFLVFSWIILLHFLLVVIVSRRLFGQ